MNEFPKQFEYAILLQTCLAKTFKSWITDYWKSVANMLKLKQK